MFGPVPNKRLCTWHVDRAWRENLPLVKDKDTQVIVYHNLRMLMEEPDVHKFKTLLTKTKQQLQTNATTADFGHYFTKTYIQRKRQWAGCYRK